MSSRKTTPRKGALGRAQFVIQADDNALEVHLDRQAFRRLLRALETLAQDGGKQDFEQSGRQSRNGGGVPAMDFSLTKLSFYLDEQSAGKNAN